MSTSAAGDLRTGGKLTPYGVMLFYLVISLILHLHFHLMYTYMVSVLLDVCALMFLMGFRF